MFTEELLATLPLGKLGRNCHDDSWECGHWVHVDQNLQGELSPEFDTFLRSKMGG